MADRAVALAIAFAAGFAFAVEVKAADVRVAMPTANAILCPSGVWIAQRHDRRDKDGRIVKSVWKRKCVESK